SFAHLSLHDTAPPASATLHLHDALPILTCHLQTTPYEPVTVNDTHIQRIQDFLRRLPTVAVRRSSRTARMTTASPASKPWPTWRSEEHTSELQSVAISYDVFCLKQQQKH